MTATETRVLEFMRKHARVGWDHDESDAVVLTPIDHWGLTSLEIVEVVMDAEQAYGVEIPDDVFSGSMTPAALAAEIDRRRERGLRRW